MSWLGLLPLKAGALLSAGSEAASNPETVEAAEHAAPEGFDAGQMILEHILDSEELHLWPLGHFHLPHLHLFGQDIPITKHMLMMWMASLILIVVGLTVAAVHRFSPGKMGHLVEMAVLFIRDEIAIPNIGKQGAKFVPYLLTTFLFILTCNLLGLVPYGATATGNISVTAGLAIMAFAMTQVAGIREHGVFKHFRHLMPEGVPIWLAPIMIPVELMSMLIKPFALCMRLFANMMGGHIVILSLLGLIFIMGSYLVIPVSIGFVLFISVLELLVAFIQAYIFTMLTSLFIGTSIHPH